MGGEKTAGNRPARIRKEQSEGRRKEWLTIASGSRGIGVILLAEVKGVNHKVGCGSVDRV
jgi:hypothetical protein